MSTPLRVLIVEDSEDDTILVLRELRRGSYEPTFERVDTPEAMNAALEQQAWDIVLSDYAMPRFSMPAALAMVKEKGLDLPFIIVSGAIGEEAAVAAMRAGAHDYVIKGNLARLVPAIERELREAEVRCERKRAEEALRESEEKWRSLAENAPNFIMIADHDHTIQFINRTVSGYNIGDTVGKSVYDFMEQEDHSIARETINQVFKTGEPGRYETKVAVPQVGSYWYETHVGPIKRDGEIVSATLISTDITERKRAEEALRESEEKFRRLVEDMNDGYCVLQGSKVVFANARSAEMFGYEQDEVIGKTVKELLPPEVVSKLSKMREKRQRGEIVPQQYEVSLVGKGGTMRPVELGTRVIDYAGKPALSVVIRDITERKRAEEERQRMEQQLHLAGRLAAVGELAAGVAHELNNPLAAVQAFAQLLHNRDDLDETARSDVETIYREAQRATRITANLLSSARRHAPEKRLISINEVIEKALELHAHRMKVNNIDLVMELDPDLPMTLADSDQMQQIFVNLTNNAEQAMTEAHGKGRLCVKTQKADKMIRIAFTDDGPGISEDNLKRIFDPFFTTKDVGKGTGLGLSICYGLVQEHGGHIYARSKLGEGTTFVVEIPILSQDERTAQEAASIQAQKS